MTKRFLSRMLQAARQRKVRLTAYGLIALVVLLAAGVVRGANAPPIIPWHVFSDGGAGGGNPASSASYTLNASLGQTAIGDSSEPNVQMGAGYWYGAIQADLVVTKAASADPVEAGTPLVYTLQVTNQGPHDASNVTLVDTLPTGVIYNSAPGCSHASGIVSCNLGYMAKDAIKTLQINVTVKSNVYGTTLTNSASVKADQVDPNPMNNKAVRSILVTGGEVIYQDDFEDPVGDEWSCTTIRQDITPVGGRRFLGQFGAETVCLTLTGLPPHDWITISFDLYVIRSWNGSQLTAGAQNRPVGPDEWEVSIPGITLLHTTFANYLGHPQAYPGWYPGELYPRQTGAIETNTLGYTYVNSPMDSVYRLTHTTLHNGNTLLVNFTGWVQPPTNDESWGLDNVVVSVEAGINQVYLPLVTR